MTKAKHSHLWLHFSLIVFSTIIVCVFVFFFIWSLLYNNNIVSVNPLGAHMAIPIITICSLLIGAFISIYIGRLIIAPIQRLSEAFDKLSNGDFEVKISEQQQLSEMKEMAKQFNKMVYQLSQVETLSTNFIANVSHEFKTPISSIEGYATLLQNPATDKQKHDHYVEKILDNTSRLSNLTSRILELSKLRSEERVPVKTRFRLDEQIRQVILLLEPKWSKKNIEFDFEVPKTYILSCEQPLERVWSNIIENAIKHSYNNGVITIKIAEDEQAIAVSIIDYGEGMSDEVKKHIFEKFYQGDSSHSKEGNGLGLALVKGILDAQGGRIDVQSEPGKGSCFTVILNK